MKKQKLGRLSVLATALLALSPVLASAQDTQASQVYKPLLPQVAAPSNAPRVLMAGEYAANAKIGQINVEVKGGAVAADGVSPMTVVVRVLDRKGQPLKDPVLLTIEQSGRARVVLHGARTDEYGPGRADVDRVVPGVQMRVEGGEGQFTLVAPAQPGDSTLRVSGGEAEVTGTISFAADMREMLASGYLEGIISLTRRRYESSITPARVNDGFEQTLRQFSSKNAKGDRAAIGGSAFLKGKIKGDMLLTMAYDSDKETYRKLQSEVNPDQYYAVYGDASVKGFDAPSASRLFVRLDKGRNYALYGDYSTADPTVLGMPGGASAPTVTRQLGAYSRKLTGLRAHLEGVNYALNAFAARDTVRLAVDELRTNGTSGPFATSNGNARSESETVTVVTRARGDLTRVIAVVQLRRGIDYVYEPFSGRIFLTQALPSEDPSGNPLTLRIEYEVEQDGEAFWVGGVDGQVNLGKSVTLGGNVVEDRNPGAPFRMASANAGVKLGERTVVVAEGAMTDAVPGAQNGRLPTSIDPVTGKAARVTLTHSGERFSLAIAAAKAGINFANVASGAIPGTQSLSVEAAAKVTDALTAKVSLQDVQANNDSGQRQRGELGVSYVLTDRILISAGVRRTQESGKIPGLYAGIGSQPAPGSYFAPSSGWALSTMNAPLQQTTNPVEVDSTRLFLGAAVKLTPRFTVSGEVESEVDDWARNNLSLGASFQAAERTRLYARAERRETGVSQYSIDGAQNGNSIALGIDSSYSNNGAVYSEYRMRDALDNATQQMGMGVRQGWDVTEGLRVVGSAERLRVFDGDGQSGIAATLGAEWTANERMKVSGRVEARRLENAASAGGQVQDTLLVTAAVAGKITRDWTALARNYYLATFNHGVRQDGWQDRLQLGVAYRPVDNNRFDMLAKYEWKAEDQIVGDSEWRRVHVAAIQGNWRPSRPWYASARLAGKIVEEGYPTLQGGGGSAYKAALLSGRVVYDITENWDIGAQAGVMRGSGGSTQGLAGVEVGYLLAGNLWLSGGANLAGFRDPDITSDYTAKGVYIRLRWKFDADLFSGNNSAVNRALPR